MNQKFFARFFSKKRPFLSLCAAVMLAPVQAQAAPEVASVSVGDGLTLAYYTSGQTAGVTRILIAVQGYTRDANRTFDAAEMAAAKLGVARATLVVAPIFQVAAARSAKCRFPGVPLPAKGDALWTCGDWSDGSVASNGKVTSFAAMDRLVAALVATYHPQMVTIAGFSAGGQYVQRYIGFADAPVGVPMRYVVADPSGWLYFDPVRPLTGAASCPGYDDWKFGTGHLPAALGRDAAAARAVYAASDTQYLEGALDTGDGPGTAYKLLERSCGAEVQGRYRLDRGLNYAAYDKAMLAHGAHRLTVVAGCAHLVTCVFPGAAGDLLGVGGP
jgi:hypothetical protein